MEVRKKAVTYALATLLATGQLNGITLKKTYFDKIRAVPVRLEQEKPKLEEMKPVKTEKMEAKRKIMEIEPKLLLRLQAAFLDEICKIRRENGLKTMPKMNQKLGAGAQEYSQIVATYQEKGTPDEKKASFWHEIGKTSQIRFFNCDIGMKHMGECISILNCQKSDVTSDAELERIVRIRARALLNSKPHMEIILGGGKILRAGVGIAVSTNEKTDNMRIATVYIVGSK